MLPTRLQPLSGPIQLGLGAANTEPELYKTRRRCWWTGLLDGSEPSAVPSYGYMILDPLHRFSCIPTSSNAESSGRRQADSNGILQSIPRHASDRTQNVHPPEGRSNAGRIYGRSGSPKTSPGLPGRQKVFYEQRTEGIADWS
nr:hypothetical protein CFP56_60753 [Quercus suber]